MRARVFGEGQGVVRAAVILTGPDGHDRPSVRMTHIDNDQWAAVVSADSTGSWTFRVESWHDPLAAWVRDAQTRFAADLDIDVTLAEGAALLRRGAGSDPACGMVADDLLESDVPAVERLATALAFLATFDRGAVRDHVSATDRYPVFVDRERALVGAWYQMFPRSEGALVKPDGSVQAGTLRTAAKRLEGIAAMGFDIVHLPPIHPIGETHRKGRDNAPVAGFDDPGSPWAVGSQHGGHDAVHPELGTLDDFDAFVERARQLDLEVALDLALQCSPDHPWVTEHPEWFSSARGRLDRDRRDLAHVVGRRLPARLRQRPGQPVLRGARASSPTGSTTASGTSASTRRTPSRCDSGSVCWPTCARSTRTSCSWPRRSRRRRCCTRSPPSASTRATPISPGASTPTRWPPTSTRCPTAPATS